MILFLCFLLRFSFNWDDISDTQDSVLKTKNIFKSNLRSICSNLHLGQFVSTQVNLFFLLFVCFCSKQKNIFLAPSILILHPPFSLHLHFTYFALPTSQSIFFLCQCLPCESWTTDLCFFFWSHVLMPYQWAMETWMQVPLFF